MMKATFTSTFDMEGFKRHVRSGVVDIAKKKFRDVVRGNSPDIGVTEHLLGLIERACKDDKDELKRFSDHIRGSKRDPETETELLDFIEKIDFQVNLDHEMDLDRIGRRLNRKRTD